MKNILSAVGAFCLCGLAMVVQQGVTFWLAIKNIIPSGLAKHSYSLRHGQLVLDGEKKISVFDLPLAGKGLLWGSLLGITIVFVGVALSGARLRTTFGLNRPIVKAALPWFGLYVILGAVFTWLEHSSSLFRSEAMDTMILASRNHAGLAILGIGVLVPIFEEVVFRGLLYRRLLDLSSPFSSVIITSLLFTVLHVQYNLAILLGVFCIGMLLGTLRWKSDSIWPGILIHCLNNTVATLIAFNSAP